MKKKPVTYFKTEMAVCPPPGWKACGTVWPPPSIDAKCCSSYGFFGSSMAHCEGIPGELMGVDATEECCTYLVDFERLECNDVFASVPEDGENCTGIFDVDAILFEPAILKKIAHVGLSITNSLYTLSGLCKAIRLMQDRTLHHIVDKDDDVYTNIANLFGFLAQAAWESGGDAPFTACDENNYRNIPTASCTQRADDSDYADLDGPDACPRNSTMQMTATTHASWTPGPLECKPGTETAGCCWWGRGAIQTTGRQNYGLLQKNVISKIWNEVNLCTNPQNICSHNDEAMKWVGGLYYWRTIVMEDNTYKQSLVRFADSSFSLQASIINGADLADGGGSLVNNGYWGKGAHQNGKRHKIFEYLIDHPFFGTTMTQDYEGRDSEDEGKLTEPESSSKCEKKIGFCDNGVFHWNDDSFRKCTPCSNSNDCEGSACHADAWCTRNRFCSAGGDGCELSCTSFDPHELQLGLESQDPPPPPSPPLRISKACCAEAMEAGLILASEC